MIELARMARSLIGSSTPIVISGSQEPDVYLRKPDISKASNLLGFNPKVGLLDGLGRVLDWIGRGASLDIRLAA